MKKKIFMVVGSLVLLGIAVIFLFTLLDKKELIIERPESVPTDAVPAIGADGGSWARCEYRGFPELFCVTYYSSDGAIWSRGTYVLTKQDASTTFSSHDFPIDQLMAQFSLFDGKTIYLEPGVRLVPDGIIDSPFRGQGGKKTVYSMGEVVTAEKQY